MGGASDENEFFGLLGRAIISQESAELRFYSFSFLNDPGAASVFVVEFDTPDFLGANVRRFMHQEVTVIVRPDRAELIDHLADAQAILRAAGISFRWATYDVEDYVQRVRQLDEAYLELSSALHVARNKDERCLSLVQELLRRAEVKAAASDDQSVRQAAAIAALKGVLEQCWPNGQKA